MCRASSAADAKRGMWMSLVTQQTYEIVAKYAKRDPETITPESTLKDLAIESLDAIEMIFDLEERFGINLPNEDTDLANGTMAQLVEAIERQLALKTAGG